MMQKTIGKMIHWVYAGLIFLLPFIFIVPLHSSFLVPKETLLSVSALVVAMLFILWVIARKGTVLVFRREQLYLTLFVIYIGVSVFFSAGFFAAVEQFLPFLAAYILLNVFLVFYQNQDRYNNMQFELIQALILAGTLEAGLAVLQYFGILNGFFSGAAGKWRVFGTMGNPNYIAEFLLPVFFINLNLLHHEPRPNYRRYYSASLVTLTVGIFCTVSRSGILLLAGGTLLYLIFYLRVTGVPAKQFLVLLINRSKRALSLIFIAFLLILIVLPVLRADKNLINHVTNKDSVTGRLFIWKNSIAAAVKYFPFGTGVGDFRKAYAEEQYRHFKSGSLDYLENSWIVARAHNDLLQLFTETGLGVIFFLLFLYLVTRHGGSNLASDNFSIGIFVAFLVMLGSSMVNFPLRVAPNLYVFVLLTALVILHRGSDSTTMVKRVITGHRFRWALVLFVPLLLLIVFPIRFLQSSYYLQQGIEAEYRKDHKGAEFYYRESFDIHPGCADAAYMQAKQLIRRGKFKSAAALIEQGLKNYPLPVAYSLLADANRQLNAPDAALNALEKLAYTYRKIIPFSVRFIKEMHRAQRWKTVRAETAQLNRIAESMGHLPDKWRMALVEANSAGLSATVADQSVVQYTGQSHRFTFVLQHTNGLLYLGSSGSGVFEYNPLYKRFTHLTNRQFSFVYSLLLHKNELWSATEQGLYIYSFKTKKWRKFEALTPEYGRITALMMHAGDLWFTTPVLIGRCNLKTLKVTTYEHAGDMPLVGLQSISKYKSKLYFAGPGLLLIMDPQTGFTAHRIQVLDVRTMKTVQPEINAVHPFGRELVGLCSDQGLITYFIPGKKIVKRDFYTKNFLDMSMLDTSMVLLEDTGAITIKDLRSHFIQINKDDLSRASVDFTENLLKRNYDNLVPNLKANLTSTRLLIYSYGYFRNWIFGATPYGLLSKGGLVGPATFETPPKTAPGLFVTALKRSGDTLFCTDETGIWQYNGNGWALIERSNSENLSLETDGNLVYFAERNMIKLLRTPYPSLLAGIYPEELRCFAVYKGWKAAATVSGKVYINGPGGIQYTVTSSSDVTDLVIVDDKVYIGTSESGVEVYRLVPGTPKLRPVNAVYGLQCQGISSMELIGDRIWIGTRKGGSAVYDPRSGSLDPVEGAALCPRTAVAGITKWPNGLFVQVQEKMLKISGENAPYALTLALPDHWPLVLSAAEMAGNDLFVAGAGGIFRYNNFQEYLTPYMWYLTGNKSARKGSAK